MLPPAELKCVKRECLKLRQLRKQRLHKQLHMQRHSKRLRKQLHMQRLRMQRHSKHLHMQQHSSQQRNQLLQFRQRRLRRRQQELNKQQLRVPDRQKQRAVKQSWSFSSNLPLVRSIYPFGRDPTWYLEREVIPCRSAPNHGKNVATLSQSGKSANVLLISAQESWRAPPCPT